MGFKHLLRQGRVRWWNVSIPRIWSYHEWTTTGTIFYLQKPKFPIRSALFSPYNLVDSFNLTEAQAAKIQNWLPSVIPPDGSPRVSGIRYYFPSPVQRQESNIYSPKATEWSGPIGNINYEYRQMDITMHRITRLIRSILVSKELLYGANFEAPNKKDILYFMMGIKFPTIPNLYLIFLTKNPRIYDDIDYTLIQIHQNNDDYRSSNYYIYNGNDPKVEEIPYTGNEITVENFNTLYPDLNLWNIYNFYTLVPDYEIFIGFPQSEEEFQDLYIPTLVQTFYANKQSSRDFSDITIEEGGRPSDPLLDGHETLPSGKRFRKTRFVTSTEWNIRPTPFLELGNPIIDIYHRLSQITGLTNNQLNDPSAYAQLTTEYTRQVQIEELIDPREYKAPSPIQKEQTLQSRSYQTPPSPFLIEPDLPLTRVFLSFDPSGEIVRCNSTGGSRDPAISLGGNRARTGQEEDWQEFDSGRGRWQVPFPDPPYKRVRCTVTADDGTSITSPPIVALIRATDLASISLSWDAQQAICSATPNAGQIPEIQFVWEVTTETTNTGWKLLKIGWGLSQIPIPSQYKQVRCSARDQRAIQDDARFRRPLFAISSPVYPSPGIMPKRLPHAPANPTTSPYPLSNSSGQREPMPTAPGAS